MGMCLVFLFTVRLELWIWGRKTTEVKWNSHHLIPSTQTINIMSLLMLILTTWLDQGFPGSSAGKESACNAGTPSLILGSWRYAGERDRLPTPVFLGFPDGSGGKESACNAGDLRSVPGLGRSLEEGKGYPLQYSDLENSMDSGIHGVSKSWTQLSNFHFHLAEIVFVRLL